MCLYPVALGFLSNGTKGPKVVLDIECDVEELERSAPSPDFTTTKWDGQEHQLQQHAFSFNI